MGKHLYCFFLILSLGLVSFISCVIAESKKAKEEDLRVENEQCYLPQSPAFGFGIAALVCLIIGQLVGNLVVCPNFKAKKPLHIPKTLLVLSW
ncbi:hypothetical protein Tsubulata_005586 [Turnera subulata]|uniref:Uncharacterized protein n=1 Tax=Turnera subulata TaxID=218843 RepID=A0A9Q0GBU9_9ROSI|nr:hypothetical protein Tsubulata_005586 [Turnera subulata]